MKFDNVGLRYGTDPEVLVAHERATGRFIGWFALFDDGWVDGLRTAELGYRLRRETWGQGFASEAAGAVRDWAWRTQQPSTLVSMVKIGNAASARVAAKLGATLTGTLVYAIAAASVHEIDRINIFAATMLAMTRAVEALVGVLGRAPDEILIDGNMTPHGRVAAWCWQARATPASPPSRCDSASAT